MPIYNFKAQFADAVRSLQKRQTIRAHGKRSPPTAGQIAHLYTGLRTSQVSLLGKYPITGVFPISISARQRIVRMVVRVGDSARWEDLDAESVEQLARDDGFASADDFFQFFLDSGGTLSGFLIKW